MLELRFLGEMGVFRDGQRLELPPSKKTRGLLAYLALTGRSHRRERLCGLLWDVADDPRGALRWSLSRLRAVVDQPEQPRIVAERDGVAFDARGTRIDILALKQRLAAGLDAAPLEELAALANEFRGELLEGLELGDFLEFQAWCVAERDEARKLHAALLRTLVARLAGEPGAALPYARTLASVEPLDETAQAGLIQILTATGRRREAEQQYQAACRLLKELGRPDTGELEAAGRGARERVVRAVATPGEADNAILPVARISSTLVGRQAERGHLEAALQDTVRGRRERVLLLTGEPGLGKTRLLDALCERVRELGGSVLEGRAFEAETGRPFGPWSDALRRLLPGALAPGPGSDLGALLPEQSGDIAVPLNRDRLFDAVLELLAARASSAPPVLLAIDDVQWLDAASAELVHYVARMSRHRPLLVILTARAGELSDNETVQRTLHGLRELGLLEEIGLGQLGREEIRELVGALALAVDADRVFAESAGNPLLALEIARWLAGPEATLPGSLTQLIRRRVERLSSEAGDVLRWAAVLGSAFRVDHLRELMALDLERLLVALELLERHALLDGQAGGSGAYAFTHDVVRRAIYSDLSQPRRRLMHLRVAQRLGQVEAAETVAAELAHHAALAGESALAARACAAAGRRFLRQFANAEAWTVARHGRRHAADLPEPERAGLLLELLQVELSARRPADAEAAATELETLAERALDQGDPEHARLGFHMLAHLRWEEGALSDAQRHMMRAELVGRAGDERAQVVALAEAARCLVLLERDLPRAEALALEASARSARVGLRPSAIADAQGMLRQHQGRLDEASDLFQQARLEARQQGDAMAEFLALEHLVVLRQEQGDWAAARRLAGELDTLGGKLREGSEAPFARALVALSGYALGEAAQGAALDAALAELRTADAKLRLAYTLTRAARVELARGEAGHARVRADEARRAAAAVGRPTETLLAGLTLAQATRALGEDAEHLLKELRATALDAAAQFARRELEQLLGQPAGGRVAAAAEPGRNEERR